MTLAYLSAAFFPTVFVLCVCMVGADESLLMGLKNAAEANLSGEWQLKSDVTPSSFYHAPSRTSNGTTITFYFFTCWATHVTPHPPLLEQETVSVFFSTSFCTLLNEEMISDIPPSINLFLFAGVFPVTGGLRAANVAQYPTVTTSRRQTLHRISMHRKVTHMHSNSQNGSFGRSPSSLNVNVLE